MMYTVELTEADKEALQRAVDEAIRFGFDGTRAALRSILERLRPVGSDGRAA